MFPPTTIVIRCFSTYPGTSALTLGATTVNPVYVQKWGNSTPDDLNERILQAVFFNLVWVARFERASQASKARAKPTSATPR